MSFSHSHSFACPSAKDVAAGLLIWGLFAFFWLLPWVSFADLYGWPLNDDPFYGKPIEFFEKYRSWQWARQNGELTASSVAHVLTGMLSTVGTKFAYRSLYVVCIVQQSLGVAVIYLLGRTLGLSLRFALLASGSLAFFPLYFGHAFTYMTDGPATAWAAIACTTLVWGCLRNDSRWLLAGSVAIGWGYWIRQTNVLVLLAPLITLGVHRFHYVKTSRPGIRELVATVVGAAIGCLLLECGSFMASSLERASDVAPSQDGYVKRAVIAVFGFALLVGWYAIPWLPILVGEAIRSSKEQARKANRICLAIAILVLLGGAAPLVLTRGNACLTNSTGAFIQNAHFGPIFLSDMDEPGRWADLCGVAWPLGFWTLLSLLALLAVSAVAWWGAWTVLKSAHAVRSAPDLRPATGLGLLAMIVASGLAICLFIEPHMDRYWMFLFPAIVVWWLLLASVGRWRLTRFATIWAACWLLLHAAMSIAFTHDMLAWNNARWQFINAKLASGVKAEAIDGGRDVNAWLRLDEDFNTSARSGDTSKWWSGRATVAIAVGNRPGWHKVGSLPWIAWATGGSTHHLLVLERDPPLTLSNSNSDHLKSSP